VGAVKIADLARAAVALSHAGLAGRGLGEERYLEPLVATLESGQTQADRWLSLYHGEWGGDLSQIYQAASL
jgi:glutamate--cysteine ligase